MPSPDGFCGSACIEDDKEAAVSAICDIAGDNVCVEGPNGSMLVRMRRIVEVAVRSLL
jgi:hypothetical protein